MFLFRKHTQTLMVAHLWSLHKKRTVVLHSLFPSLDMWGYKKHPLQLALHRSPLFLIPLLEKREQHNLHHCYLLEYLLIHNQFHLTVI
ncbi:hypothetical protein CRM99_04880 [Listeria monocytogenes]|nr:hypothetical protein CRM99_04880 [Listeria monocytogenes]